MQKTYEIDEKSAGGILLSMTTALPEIVALISFAMARQAIAAVGSILGSHIFNYSLVFYGDLAYSKGPIMTAEHVNEV
jgi:cation:H+ antiporter